MADRRLAEVKLTKILPVLFILVLIVTLIVIYVDLHILPLLKSHHEHDKGVQELCVFAVFTGLLLVCYARAVLTHPGEVPAKSPDGSVDWIVSKYSPDTDPLLADDSNEPFLQESKRNGARRRCKYCAEASKVAVQFKPDRCHHCKLCGTCILKMDHHCPWIYNCVGFRNHKYFLLTVFYSVLCTYTIFFTMWNTVEASVEYETDERIRFGLIFGQTITALLGSLVTIFFYFHVWLVLKGMTTIEFCEKQRTRGYNASIYDRGCYGNLEAALGPRPLLWLLPLSPPKGDGLSFSQAPPTESTPLRQERKRLSAAKSSREADERI